jgi:alanyl-tRNA synthetase
VRRVEALVGVDAYKFLAREHVLLNSLTQLIKGARVEELPERINDLLEKMKEIEKELSQVRSAKALAAVSNIAKSVEKVGQFDFIGSILAAGISGEDLRAISLELRNQFPASVIALISDSEEKSVLVVATSEAARSLGAKAGALVKAGSAVMGGGGGGKDDFAQGGGTEVGKSLLAISAIRDLVASL